MTDVTFDNNVHNALFYGGNGARANTTFTEKWSDLILSALRAVGVFDNIVIAEVPPADRTRLWLDTRPHPDLPSVLRISNPATLEWNPITFTDLFDPQSVSIQFETLALLLANTDTMAEGSIVIAEKEAFVYRVAPAAATDQHLTTAAGDKLYEAGFNFSTRDLRTATDASAYRQGQVVFIRGEPMLVDSTATGSDSATNDLGVGGLRSLRPDVIASFNLVDDTSPQLGGVLDANGNQIRWANGGDVGAVSNTLTLPDTGNSYNVNSGNSVINEIVFGGTAGSTVVMVQFTQVVTLTNSANLVLPGGADILTAPGDYGFFRRAPNGVKHCAFYQRADGTALVQSATTTPAVEFISSIDFSGESSGNFIGFDAGMYDSYIFDFANVAPATNNAILRVRTSSNGGTSYDSGGSNYQWARSGRLGNIDGNANGSASGILLAAGISSSSNFGLSGRMILTGPHLSARTQVTMQSSYRYGASLTHSVISSSGMRDSSSDVDAIQFSMSTGNISSGTITMYGVRNS